MHDLVIRAVDASVLPVTQLPAVLERMANADARRVRGRRQNRLAVSNAMTHVWKGRNLAALPRRSQALHGLLDSVCSLTV